MRLYKFAGYNTFREWSIVMEDHAELFRMLVQNAAAWLYRRITKQAAEWPWRWASFGDGRLAAVVKRAEAEKLHVASGCDVGKFASTLDRLSASAKNMCDASWTLRARFVFDQPLSRAERR